jgi:RNA polymerase sigma-70 factor, ECF subfamily
VNKRTEDTGRQAEFAGFMRAYQDMVFSTAARITGNDAQGQDIAQDVFLKAYEDFDRLRDSPAAGGWLKTVARNLALNHVTRYRRRWRFFSELPGPSGDEDEGELPFALPGDASSGIDAALRHTIVEEALNKLPDAQRLPIVLYHFEEMPYEEIARRLSVSLAKVKVDIHRGRVALARQLAASGVIEAPGAGS